MASHRRKSKRQSGTSIPPVKQLEAITFFVDRSLGGKVVPEKLRAVGLNIERHEDNFAQDAPDIEWLTACGDKGWDVFTKDRAIRSNELELTALINAGVATFVITSAGMSGDENADAYINALPQIAHLLAVHQRPFIARVSPQGVVTLWIDSEGKDLIQASQERRRKRKEQRKKDQES